MKQKAKRLLACVLSIMLIIPCFSFTASASGDRTVLYVATDGKDTNAGTIDAPFASLEKARDTIRTLKKAGTLGKGGAIVYIRGGEYLIQKGIEFTKEDSGTEDAPIIYRNYPDEKVSFNGGAKIPADNFKKLTDSKILNRIVSTEAREKILTVNLFSLGYTEIPEQSWPGSYSYSWGMQQIHGKTQPEAVASELIVDSKAMTIARYPNDKYMIISEVIEPGENVRMWYDDKMGQDGYISPENRKPTPFTVVVDDGRVVNWTEAKDALLTGAFGYSWASQTIPLGSITKDKRAVTSKYPSEYTAIKGQHFYIYNLVEEIDIPGEYFVDRESGALYIYPPEEGMNEIVYTTLEDNMFTLNETEYLTLKGIDMSYMRNGGVNATAVKGVTIENCEIFYTGNRAIVINGSDNRVYDCYIHDVEGGINISGGDRKTLTSANSIIENCELENCDRITKSYMPGIYLSGVGVKALNNKVHGADHTVIQIGGNENVIAYNEIFDACTHTDDMGAIYTGRAITQRGNKIFSNYIHDIGGADLGDQGVHAIFLDDYWSAAKIEGNVFENITGWGAMFAGSYNEANNNIFVNVQKGIVNANRSYDYNSDAIKTYAITFDNELKNIPYLSDVWVSKYPEIVNAVDQNGKHDVGNYIKVQNNVAVNSAALKINSEYTKTATVANNISFSADPGFYDAENRNYLLKEDSEVYKKLPDFKPVIFTRMGMYSDRALARIKNAYVFCTDSPYVFKNGEKVNAEKVQVLLNDGEVYIPLRSSAEAIGAEIGYDEVTEKITVSAAGKVFEFINGTTEKVMLDDTEYIMEKPLINKEHTNYIALSELIKIFEKQLISHNGIFVISDTEGLFNTELDLNLLRYIEAQLSVY